MHCRDTNADTQAFVDNLLSHKYQALVLDATTVLDMAWHYAASCNLIAVGDAFSLFDLSTAFPAAFPDDVIRNISASTLRLQVRAATHNDTTGSCMQYFYNICSCITYYLGSL